MIFHFCPTLGTIKTTVFHLCTLWVLLEPWFSVCPENSQVGITVLKYTFGIIESVVFHLSTSWVLLGPWFSVFPENSQAGSTVQKHVWYY